MISEHAVLGCLAQAVARGGWSLMTSGSLLDGWHLVYHSRLDDYHVFLDLDEEWVYLQCPLLPCAPNPQSRTALHEFLLRTNDRMFFAKFVLLGGLAGGPEESIALVCEAPVETFDAGLFRLMTEAIVRYVEDYGRELRSIALDPAVAALYAGTDVDAAAEAPLEIVVEAE